MPVTPMMQQYLDTKEQYPDTILFFRLGDFYEMFFEDAKLVSRELELTLTGKDCGLSERAPMCGVPYHAVDVYVRKLIEKGYKVAICEQMTDPALSKGLVEREVVRIITPGTVFESSLLEEKKANYIVSVCLKRTRAGCAFCDVSTGEFRLYEIEDVRGHLCDELTRIAPSELIVNDREQLTALDPEHAKAASVADEQTCTYTAASKVMAEHFRADIKTLGFEEQRLAVCAAGALLAYLTKTQKNALSHILHAELYDSKRYMALDRSALRNLELTEATRTGSRRGSLLWILDHTRTSMGSRLLRSWIERPLMMREDIENRLDAIGELVMNPMEGAQLREILSGVYDVERLLSRIAYDAVNARDCLALRSSLSAVPMLKAAREAFSVPLLLQTFDLLDPIEELTAELERAIDPDAPISVKDGGMIRRGYNDELDELRDVAANGRGYVQALEQKEREETGISKLKIGYNRVFGYYFEVSKSFLDQVPYRFTRKQTLANAERFITEELKALENKILGADENATRLEYELFCGIRTQLKDLLPRLQATAQAMKTLDALLSLAQAAEEYNYVRPTINDEGRYEILNGRHPVVEDSIGREKFVPNDTSLNEKDRVMIITGPNMAGKSTYMRQVALITLMAHMGSFVPAEQADIALTDRIFTRIGASDDLYGGQSTFMVEMSEMATILKYATNKSLLILDEVGRGTSTFDGLSIAWAAVEHIAGEKCGARTLFATHYHELSELEGILEGVVNYRITAREMGEDVIFLRKIVPGGADHSYGVAVAKLAGLPKSLIARARQIMARLEVDGELNGSIGKTIIDKHAKKDRQLGFDEIGPIQLVQEIGELDVVAMTPIEALNKLFELVEKHIGSEHGVITINHAEGRLNVMPIRILDAATIGRIAAGEVVERPSSVVKELIENSLDAGATSVTVEIRGGGIDYLRVTDNGCGIEPGQVRLAFENHATSKLQRAEQLDDIRTLGFRGEALPSIAAVSRVEMSTRAKGQESGMRLNIEGGGNIQVRETGCPQGTTIVMRDLFYNVPVRRGFLKKASYEGGLVSDAVSRMLLGNPGVSMRFISGGSTLYHSFGDGKLRHAVFAVYGRDTAEKMIDIDASEGGVRIHGLIGVGDLGKATRAHQMFFINGRSVRCALLSRALEQVCRSRVTIGMYPMCVLNLVLPPTSVDVNVHPNKLEVRFRDEDMMRVACERLLGTAFEGERMLDLAKAAADRPVVERVSRVREIPLPPQSVPVSEQKEIRKGAEETPKVVSQKEHRSEVREKHEPKGEQLVMPIKEHMASRAQILHEGGEPVPVNRPIRTVDLSVQSEKRPEPVITVNKEIPVRKDTRPVEQSFPVVQRKNNESEVKEIPPYRIIGVLFKTYILVETGEALLMIDQHAAHERLQYERFMARAEAGAASQQLLTPIMVRLSAKERATVEENLSLLEDAGYGVEPFGENEIRITAVPFVLGKAENRPLFLEMLHTLSSLKTATVDVRRAEIAQMACKSAVKGGDTLTDSEMRALVESMLASDAPSTCPHGRPVVRTMSRREIEKMFKRIQRYRL